MIPYTLIMTTMLLIAAACCGALLAGAGLLHLLPHLGRPGRALSDAMCRAPMLDVLVTYFTVAPLFAGPIFGGWLGLAGAVVGQVAAVLLWTLLHELTHPAARRGPRVVKVINRLVGPVRNHLAVWTTALVVPMFWIVRMAQIFIYPALIVLIHFPRYRQSEWVNVSRHKFTGLVGHDLIWCLYCDWMTGIWSLGSEMLRNVESFWCPIRFAGEKKCDRCSIEFPDLATDWIAANGTMKEVAALLESKYPGPDGAGNGWYGHPARLTVNGADAHSRATSQNENHPTPKA